MPCYKPIKLKDGNGGEMPVPCNKCVGCGIDYSRQWAARCYHEAQLHKENCCLTLTYDLENMPWGFDRPTLYPLHLQLFMKRYRKRFGNGIRFFACGEYGGTTSRPHYHAIIFGHDFEDKIFWKTTANGSNLYTSVTLDNLWTHGLCAIGDVDFQSVAYVARYVMDKRKGAEGARYYEERGIEPEFARMSRRPGIGFKWFEKYASDVYPDDFITLKTASKCKTPRYYDNLLKEIDSQLFEQIKATRKTHANETNGKLNRVKRAISERAKLAQISTLSRGL